MEGALYTSHLTESAPERGVAAVGGRRHGQRVRQTTLSSCSDTLRVSSVGTDHLVSRIWTEGEAPLTNHQGSHGFSRPSGSSGNFFSSINFMLSVYCHASRALHRSHHALRFGRVSSVSARPAGPNT